MKYALLENGDIVESEDEFYCSDFGWAKVSKYVVGVAIVPAHLPIRRLIDKPNRLKPIESFTVPCGTWSGCTGEVFMDGDDKKVRLHNVFVGGKQLVIDFPRRERYDNKHIVLEDDDIIQDGDLFLSGPASGILACQSTIGMTVERAYERFNSIVRFVRPVA
jgi:hypothetical protein